MGPPARYRLAMAAPQSRNGRPRRLARPRDVALPFVRTRRLMSQAGRNELEGQQDELPIARPTIAVALTPQSRSPMPL